MTLFGMDLRQLLNMEADMVNRLQYPAKYTATCDFKVNSIVKLCLSLREVRNEIAKRHDKH